MKDDFSIDDVDDSNSVDKGLINQSNFFSLNSPCQGQLNIILCVSRESRFRF